MNNDENKLNPAKDENTFFSIRRHDMQEDGEYFYIRANPAGLKKYAEVLNSLAQEIEEKGDFAETKLPSDPWIKGDITLDYVEIVSDIPTESEILLEPQNIEPSRSGGYGCVIGTILLIIATIVGFLQIGRWIMGYDQPH